MKFTSFVRLFGTRGQRQAAGQRRRTKAPRPAGRAPRKSTDLRLEALEDRTVPSTLPAANTVVPQFLDQNNQANLVAPVIAVDPVNSQKLVSVYVQHQPHGTFNAGGGSAATDRSILQGKFSADGGKTWGNLPLPLTNLIDPTDSLNRAFLETTDPSVAIDRNENVYLVYSEHSNNLGPVSPAGSSYGTTVSGVIVLQKLNISDAALADQTPDILLTDQLLYRWTHQDPALHPVVAVDNTLPGAGSPTPGAVYVAWSTNNQPPSQFATDPGYNPNLIMLTSSINGGLSFSNPTVVSDGPANGTLTTARNAFPELAVSEGRPGGSPAGQVNLVWTAWDEQNIGQPTNPRIVTDHVQGGSASVTFPANPNSNLNVTIADARQNYTIANNTATRVFPDTPQTTSVFQTVAIPANFKISDLDVTVAIAKGNVEDMSLLLVPPSGPSVRLLRNAENPSGNVITPAQGIQNATAANLGVLNNVPVGTVFDDQASKVITDPSNQPPFAGRFRPELGSLQAMLSDPNFNPNGNWELRIVDNFSEGPNKPNGTPSAPGPNTGALQRFVLQFSAGKATNNPDTVVANVTSVLGAFANARTNAFPTVTVTAQPAVSPDRGIFPAPVIAADNTLGGPYQGRLYVAYVGSLNNAADGFDILLKHSDDGGATWSNPVRVNDDNPLDGFSEGNRPQFLPSLAVDQTTGTLVVTYYDARHDAAQSRVQRTIATSIDGGDTFGPQTFLNRPNNPLDAITGQRVTLGPIPDNQSAGNPLPGAGSRDLVFGFGDREGLAVADGRVYAVWSGNEDNGPLGINNGLLGILVSTSATGRATTVPDGPRVVSSDMGPVTGPRTTPVGNITYDNTVGPDGTAGFDGFVITFDRPVDPGAFGTIDSSKITVTYRSANTSGNNPGIPVPIASVTPLDLGVFGPNQVQGATQFLVRILPQYSVGTYSYTVGPNIADRIRTVDAQGNTKSTGNLMDQNSDGTTGADPTQDPGDIYAVPQPLNPTASLVVTNPATRSFYFRPPFANESLPIVVPGPHVVSTSAPNIYEAPPIELNKTVPQRTTSQIVINNLPATTRITDVNVSVSINYPRAGDLTLTLIAPDGTHVVLAQNRGGGAANYFNTTFDDQALKPVATAAAPFTGGFLPESPLGLLNGKNPNGTWTLLIEDASPGTFGQLVGWTMAVETTDSYTAPFDQVNLRLPPAGDGGPAAPAAVSTISVGGLPAGSVVTDVNVNVNLTHPRVSDLVLSLVGPDGTEVLLSQNQGGFGANYTNTTFDDQAANPVTFGAAPFTASFRPQVPLSTFNGKQPNGDWKLKVVDTVTGQTGTLLGWSLALRTLVGEHPAGDQVALPVPQYTTSTITVSGLPDDAVLSGLSVNLGLSSNHDGNLKITLIAPDQTEIRLSDRRGGTGQNFVNTTFADTAATAIGDPAAAAPFTGFFRPDDALALFNGKNANGLWVLKIEDEGQGNAGQILNWSMTLDTKNVYTVPATQVGGLPQVNLNIPDGVGRLDSRINVNASEVEAITDVKVNVLIQHPNDADLLLSLEAPDGTSVQLAGSLSGANLTNTTFSNAGAPLAAGVGPYTGTFRPDGNLGAFNGKNPAGFWTLHIQDRATGATGTLQGWSLTFTTQDTRTGDNLILNNQARAIDVSFDRDIDPTSVSPRDILTLIGPAGQVSTDYTTYNSTDVNRAIPDVSPAVPLVSTLSIPDNFNVGDLRVRLNITHVRDSDLTVTLVAPNGARVKLVAGAGTDPNAVNNQNFSNTEFDDSAVVSIQDTDLSRAHAPYANIFRPLEPLSQLQGMNINGTWRLEVVDNSLGKSGTLNGWSIIATPLRVIPNPFGTEPANHVRTFRFLLATPQTLSGTYVLTLGPDIRSVVRPIPNSLDGDLDSNLNAGVDALRDVVSNSTLPTTPTKYSSTDVTNFTIAPGQTRTSILNVPDDFDINSLLVQLNLTAPNPSGLQATLIAPDGTRVRLFSNVPVPLGSGQNFQDTIFDDNAPVPISAGEPPFRDRFQPQDKLSQLRNRSSFGTTANATPNPWKLEIVNTGATGTAQLNSWSLSFLRTVAPIFTASPNTPVALPGATTTRSTLSLPDSFVIQGATLTLDISDANDPDLEAALIAPDGTRVQLFTNVGNSGTKQNFTSTVFDDRARNGLSTTPIQNGSAPFFGRFNPQQPLSTLNGHGSFGTWTLEIKNDGTATGVLNSWSLTLLKPVPTFGLGEPNEDRTSATFRLFTMDPANPASHQGWTAVGPASSDQRDPVTGTIVHRGISGQIGALAVDPSDPTGNTVFVAGATGGVWKTVNFLTTDPDGPTYLPLTDFGPTLSINISSLAIVGRNNNPDQSLVIAATGNQDSATPQTGAGLLISQDGGATWALIDSTDNTLPLFAPTGQPQRDHLFVGTIAYKVVADPRPTPAGEAIIYMAVADPTAAQGVTTNRNGVWRSIDSGKHWVRILAGDATDVVLDPNSGYFDAVSNPAGNLQILYAGLRGLGIFRSPDRGQTWAQMLGGVNDPNINGGTVVNPPASTPNGANVGRIQLVKPALVPSSDPAAFTKNLLYEGWLYALVASPAGGLDGLYLTKDFGFNWTRVSTFTNGTVFDSTGRQIPIPTNDNSKGTYSPVGPLGDIDISLAIDPTNPNVIYVGGTLTGNKISNLIRIDTTGISDAHSWYLSYDRSDGGQLRRSITDGITSIPFGGTGFLNLIQDPFAPFKSNSAFSVAGTGPFANTGAGVTWLPLDAAIAPDPFDPNSQPTANQHRLITYVDPLTGHARLVFGDDEGVFTAVDRGDGSLIGSLGGTTNLSSRQGNVQVVSGTRNGNLQLTQFFYGAAQPSNLAIQLAQALTGNAGFLYGTTQSAGFPVSDPNVLTNGVLTWTGDAGLGAGIATDQTGSGTVYVDKAEAVPSINPPGLNFFQVNGVGRTFGLLQSINDPQWPRLTGVNFAVNPVDGNDIVISSLTGNVFTTTTQGRFWLQIAGTSDLDGSGTNVPALAYGAADPNGVAGGDPLNFLLYAGTDSGNVFVTFTGGGSTGGSTTWFNITNGDLAADRAADVAAGLPAPGIRAIVTNPNRGSHEAYLVTRNGVYHISDSMPQSGATNTSGTLWQNITGNLFQVTQDLFKGFRAAGTPIQSEALLQSFGLEAIQADWRYAIPDDPNNPTGPTHPALYVAGDGGVYRSLDNGQTWSLFPNQATDGAATDGGSLPNAHVTDLDLVLGNVNPTTGRALLHDRSNPDPARQETGPDVLVASTFGRGAYAIRVAPVIVQAQVSSIANLVQPIVTGLTEQTAFGNTVRVTLLDLTDPTRPRIIGGFDPNNPSTDNPANWTDGFGRFSLHPDPGVFKTDGSTDGPKVLGVQASDDSGTFGAIIKVNYVLNTTPLVLTIRLDPGSDSGDLNNDGITNVVQPTFTGTVAQATPVTLVLVDLTGDPNPNDPNAPIIGSGGTDINGNFSIQVQPGAFRSDGLKAVGVRASNGRTASTSLQTTPTVVFTLDTTPPAAPTVNLSFFSDTGASNADHVTRVTTPVFAGTGEPAQAGKPGPRVRIFAKNVATGTEVQINADPVTPDRVDVAGTYSAAVRPNFALPDGEYVVTADQIDAAGNVSPRSQPLTPDLVIVSQPVGQPTVVLDPGSDTGTPGDNITAAIPQVFDGTAPAGSLVTITDTSAGVTTTFGPFDSSSANLNVPQLSTVGGVTAVYTQLTPTDFQVSINLGDGAHQLQVHVANVSGVTSASGALTVTVDRNSLDADRKFIRQLYSLALGRTGALAEWNYWIQFLTLPNGRQAVANAIERSQEARTHLVTGWYNTYLGRLPKNGEEQYWVQVLLAGVTEEDVLANLLSSDEYYFHAPKVLTAAPGAATDTTFIQALYQQLLHRPAGAADLQFWVPLVQQVSRAQIAKAILVSQEYRSLVVASYYLDLLRRPTQPSPQEFYFWVLSPFDLTTMRVGFESSEEFFMRIGGLVTS